MNKRFRFSVLNNNTDCIVIDEEAVDELAYYIKTGPWAPGIFKDNYRTAANFVSADLFGLDVDGGCTLEEAKRLFADYKHIIATTRNHQKEKNGVTCDRFRVILFLERPITTKEENYATFYALQEKFPFIDEACKDASRMFYASVGIESVRSDGMELPVAAGTPVRGGRVFQIPHVPLVQGGSVRGRLSTTTLRFCVEGAPEGSRHKTLVKALLDFKQQGYTQEEASERLKHLALMDDRAWATVADIYNNREVRHAPRLPDSPEVRTEGLENWVTSWLKANNVAVSYSRVMYMGSEYTNQEALLRKMRIDRMKQGKSPATTMLEDLFREWVEERVKQHLALLKESMGGYELAAEVELRKFVCALTGNTHTDIDHEVLRHFIWQVKRKLFGLKVEHHIMPIIYGPQGSGKTTAVRKLLQPLGDLISTPNGFACVRDERQARIFIDYFVIFFDEMAQAERTDVNELKNYITTDIVEFRPMGTNDRVKGPNMATLIGASNRRVPDIIMDDTGARRFYEITVPTKCDWAALNEVDFALLWKSADENSDTAPIALYIDEISKIQDTELRHKGPVEEWVEEQALVMGGGNWSLATDLLRDFNEWYSQSYTATAFGRALRRLGVPKRHTVRGSEYALAKAKVPGGLKLVGDDF